MAPEPSAPESAVDPSACWRCRSSQAVAGRALDQSRSLRGRDHGSALDQLGGRLGAERPARGAQVPRRDASPGTPRRNDPQGQLRQSACVPLPERAVPNRGPADPVRVWVDRRQPRNLAAIAEVSAAVPRTRPQFRDRAATELAARQSGSIPECRRGRGLPAGSSALTTNRNNSQLGPRRPSFPSRNLASLKSSVPRGGMHRRSEH